MRRLTLKELPIVKQALLAKQGNICAICQRGLTTSTGVMDHDHVTGQCRGVLCRACNGMEGKIKNILVRWGRGAGVEWLGRLILYWIKYKANPNQFLYPTHRDEDEKRILRNTKARKARAKTKKG